MGSNWKYTGIVVIVFCFSAMAFELRAQAFTGTIKGEKSFITVSAAGYQSAGEISKAWGVSEEEIITANKGVTFGSFSGQSEVFLPIETIIQGISCQSCKPVYHLVSKGEGLYRIGKCYGNTPVATLKKLNQLRSDALQPGQELLVGYVSAPQTGSVQPSGTGATEMQVPLTQLEKPESLQEPVVPDSKNELIYRGPGMFEPDFQPDSNYISSKQGKAASFKSESGWKDGRFYMLNSQLKNGVVVKLTHLATGKSIFAKVVGPLPKIKQNENLDWRLSNAAAASLGVWDDEEIMELLIEY